MDQPRGASHGCGLRFLHDFRRGAERQREGYLRAAAGRLSGVDGAAVRLDDRPADGESEAGARRARFVLAADEQREDFFLPAVGKSAALVDDADDGRSRPRAGR